jgi:hypothetical protein
MLVDRKRELDELNRLLAMPTAQLVAVSGRRRLGKTALLRQSSSLMNFPTRLTRNRVYLPHCKMPGINRSSLVISAWRSVVAMSA